VTYAGGPIRSESVSQMTDTVEATQQVNTVAISTDTGHLTTLIHVYTHTHIYRFLSGCKEVENRILQSCSTSQLPTTSQHHSPTQILPHNHINIRIHAHTMPTHTSRTRTCMLTTE